MALRGRLWRALGGFHDGDDWEFHFAMAGIASLLVRAYLASQVAGRDPADVYPVGCGSSRHYRLRQTIELPESAGQFRASRRRA